MIMTCVSLSCKGGSENRGKSIKDCLQPAAVNDLVVDSELAAAIVDDENPDTATAVGKRILETAEEVALVEDGQALLDVASLSHGNNTAVVTDVEDAVLLEDRAEHVLHHDARAGVGDEGALLVQLLGEEINTEVTVLASLSRGGDADDLARTALQDQQVTNADMVARDGDGVGRAAALDIADRGLARSTATAVDVDVDVNLLADIMVVVVVATAQRMPDTLGSTVQAMAEGVVLAVFVVVTHVVSVTRGLAFLDGDVFGGVSVASGVVDVDGAELAVVDGVGSELGVYVTTVRLAVAARTSMLAGQGFVYIQECLC